MRLTFKVYDMIKMALYGAGQIGTQVITKIINSNYNGEAHLTLFAPHNHSRVAGAIEDMKDSLAFVNQTTGWRFEATNDVSKLEDSEVVFFCAGKFPQQEEYAEAAKKGIDDRLLQAVQNIEIINQFCENINRLCPKAKVFIVTNPVDFMTEIARKNLPQAEVFGLGCALDSARFKRELSDALNIKVDDVFAYIIGHHCGTMFLHKSSLVLRGGIQPEASVVEEALAKTRARGLTITHINSAATTQKLNNGAYFAPATMVAEVMRAIVENETLLLPLNRPIMPEDKVGFEAEGKAAQLLCRIEGMKITPQFLDFSLEADRKDLQHSIEEYEKSTKALAAYIG